MPFCIPNFYGFDNYINLQKHIQNVYLICSINKQPSSMALNETNNVKKFACSSYWELPNDYVSKQNLL